MNLKPRTHRTEEDVVHLPKIVFPVNPTGGPVIIEAKTPEGDFVMHIGGVAPLGSKQTSQFGQVTVASLRIILRLLYRRRFDSNEVPLFLAELLARGDNLPSRADGGQAYERLRRSIERLTKVWIHVYHAGKENPETEQLLSFRGSFGKKGGREKISNLVFAPSFWKACGSWTECWPVRADAFDLMSSDLAAGAYMVLAPNTYAKRPGERMRKDAADLLRELNITIPDRVSQFRYLFERTRASSENAKTVLQQLDGTPVGEGLLRVLPELELNAAGTGFNVVYWREEAATAKSRQENAEDRGALEKIWIEDLGLPAAKFITAQVKEHRTILPHEMDLMASFGYELGPHRHYVETVRSFIGPRRFHDVLHGVKGTCLEGNKIGDVGKYFGGALRREFVAWGTVYAKGAR